MKEADAADLQRERMHDPSEPPEGDSYRAVLNLAASKGFRGLLVVHNHLDADALAFGVLEELRGWTISRHTDNKWPGTTTGEPLGVTVVVFDLTPDALDVLRRVETFTDWSGPDLPEDLALLRPDGTTWLATVAHEGWVWFEVTEAEKVEIELAVPTLAPLVRTHTS